MDGSKDAPRSARPKRTSELLDEFARGLTAPSVSVSEIVGTLGDRGLGLLLAIFSLPNVIPTTVPGATILFGLPSFVFSIQLMLGGKRFLLPRFIGDRTLDAKKFRALSARLVTVLSWIERLLRPRLVFVTGPMQERFIGAFCVLLAVGAAAPIPFGHNLPALALTIIGLGLIESDGLALIVGLVIGTVGFAVAGFLLFSLARVLHYLRHTHGMLHSLYYLLRQK